jgi:hypothetical protein
LTYCCDVRESSGRGGSEDGVVDGDEVCEGLSVRFSACCYMDFCLGCFREVGWVRVGNGEEGWCGVALVC